MAELGQLKKRLRSVELSAQLAGAMKTASSAKYSKIFRIYSAYRTYAAELEKLTGIPCAIQSDKEKNQPEQNKECYVVLGYNKGLCGGYNSELHSFAENFIKDNGGGFICVCGKKTISYFKQNGIRADAEFILPDIPDTEACQPLFEAVLPMLFGQKVNSVTLLYQSFVNTLTQKPAAKKLYPFTPERIPKSDIPDNGILLVPDRETVVRELGEMISRTVFFETVIEAALGAQAATLMAMRTAYDNATETAEKLKNEINRKRQMDVTAGVIETSAGMSSEWEDEDGNWK